MTEELTVVRVKTLELVTAWLVLLVVPVRPLMKIDAPVPVPMLISEVKSVELDLSCCKAEGRVNCNREVSNTTRVSGCVSETDRIGTTTRSEEVGVGHCIISVSSDAALTAPSRSKTTLSLPAPPTMDAPVTLPLKLIGRQHHHQQSRGR